MGDADTVLSACTNPFYWYGVEGSDRLSTHYEWREFLTEVFSIEGSKTLDMLYIAPIELSSSSGGFRGVMDVDGTSFVVEIMAIPDGDQWLLSTMWMKSVGSSIPQ